MNLTPFPNFAYLTATITDFAFAFEKTKSGRSDLVRVSLFGQDVIPSPRFLPSLQRALRLHQSMFSFFTAQEVFESAKSKQLPTKVRVTVEQSQDGQLRALGVTDPAKNVITVQNVGELASTMASNLTKVAYDDGVVQLYHSPGSLVGAKCAIAGEPHSYQCQTNVPIDGIGRPSNYLAMLRLVCMNGVVAWHPSFRSTIPVSKRLDDDPVPTMTRFIAAYQDENGYAALRQRLESARTTTASLREAYQLKSFLDHEEARSLHRYSDVNQKGVSDVDTAFFALVGRIEDLYGVTAIDALSHRRQRLSPTNALVSDLLNFATELATHRAPPKMARKLNAWVGSALCGEYDLEGAPVARRDSTALYLAHSESR